MFKIGADPELFVFKDGVAISGHGMIKGTKHDPFKVNHGAVQVDGMALEFNIDPAETEQEFITNIEAVMEQLRSMVPGYDLAAIPTAHFSKEYMNQQPPEALELGCDPDYNAYTGKTNPRPNGNRTFRTGAGHIHIGWCEGVDPMLPEHFEVCCQVARQLDYYLGLGSLLWDDDHQRRTMYGKAGCFRPKPYGVEYRTLSNAWLKDKNLMSWVYRTTQHALRDLQVRLDRYVHFDSVAKNLIDEGKDQTNNKLLDRVIKQRARDYLAHFGVQTPVKVG